MCVCVCVCESSEGVSCPRTPRLGSTRRPPASAVPAGRASGDGLLQPRVVGLDGSIDAGPLLLHSNVRLSERGSARRHGRLPRQPEPPHVPASPPPPPPPALRAALSLSQQAGRQITFLSWTWNRSPRETQPPCACPAARQVLKAERKRSAFSRQRRAFGAAAHGGSGCLSGPFSWVLGKRGSDSSSSADFPQTPTCRRRGPGRTGAASRPAHTP